MSGRCEAVVVGNSVAAMMAALSLGESGKQVTLLAPSNRLGGHFAGLTLGDQLFDAGMVFLEFTSFNADSNGSLESYDPYRRNDVGRLLPLVERALQRFGSWRNVPAPLMHVTGTLLPDMLIANRIEALRQLPSDTQTAIDSELRMIVAPGGSALHARHKVSGQAFETATLEAVSLANHGRILHDLLIEPYCRKVLCVPSARLLARYHRLAWLPLYYPETLLDGLCGQASLLATDFSYPTTGSTARLIREMERQLRAARHVTISIGTVTAITRAGMGGFRLLVNEGEALETDALVWAADPEHLLNLAGEPPTGSVDRSSVTLASLLVETTAIGREFSSILLPEDPSLPFRITNQTVAAGEDLPQTRLSCEWETSALSADADQQRTSIAQSLLTLGIIDEPQRIRELRVDTVKGALVLPTPTSVANWSDTCRRLDTMFPDVPRLGQAAPFGATSLNDQIVQGLKAVLDLREEE